MVLVVLDSVRPDHLSAYGYSRTTTPNIDRLAETGLLFPEAYSASCWTIPAHGSLFTGTYPSRHGADLGRDIEDRYDTLAQHLASFGYRTAAVSCNGFVARSSGLDRGFQLSLDVNALRGHARGLGSRLVRGIHRRWRDRFAKDRGAARASDLAARWLGEQERNEPFFLFLNYMECHLPYRLRGSERHRFVESASRREADDVPQDPFAVMAGSVELSEAALNHLRNLYDGGLHYMDRHVGALVERLRQLGLYDSTLFVVTSDHGESFGEHGLLDHQYGLYEHLIAVPLLMRLPGGERRGETHQAPVQHVDLLPTIAGLLGDGADNDWQGRSILEQPAREAVVAEYLVPNLRAIRRRFPAADTRRFDVALRSVRVGQDKLILRSDGGRELYDLEADPGEMTDLANDRADRADRLERRLFAEVGAWPTAPSPKSRRDLEAMADRLRGLGYL